MLVFFVSMYNIRACIFNTNVCFIHKPACKNKNMHGA